MDKTLLKGESLTREYGNTVITTALDNVSIILNNKEFASIIGPSGCGKSTLLNMLGALDRPTRGTLIFRDKNLSEMNDEELAAFRNMNIGFIFQSHHLLPEFTALENVLLPTWIGTRRADKKGRPCQRIVRVGRFSRPYE